LNRYHRSFFLNLVVLNHQTILLLSDVVASATQREGHETTGTMTAKEEHRLV
jgi:hypothetical protein